MGTETTVATDYLVVGAGAMGMAFTDVVLAETDANVTVVDRHARPGGHWNDAYPFVRLHQPSAFYGVNSRPLGGDRIDPIGWNQGLYELASGTEVVTYFDQVMRQQFLPTGRVQYLPLTHHHGDGRVTSLVSDREWTVTAGGKTVDATYMNVTVPSTSPPRYGVADGVHCGPLNELATVSSPADGYVIVGAGKTGADACLFLLANGVEPDRISWIMPRDSWYLDRADIQPGRFFDRTTERFVRQTVHIAESASVGELFQRLEADGLLLRLDPDIEPTMYRCSTITTAELEQLRRIDHVIRLGRVRRIEPDRIVLDGGTVPTTPSTFHVDCSADGLERRPAVPIFDEDRLTLQTVRHCQQVFSAALIGHVEAAYDDDETKNELCTVVPHPDSALDWLRCWLGSTSNMIRWRLDPEIGPWLEQARLDGFSQPVPPSDAQRRALATAGRRTLEAIEQAQRHLASAEASEER